MENPKRTEAILKLGPLRSPVLWCLEGLKEESPFYLKVNYTIGMIDQFEEHMELLEKLYAVENHHSIRSLLSAGRLLCGSVDEADWLVENFLEPVRLGEPGKGRCRYVPFRALSGALPLPADLQYTTRWLAGSPEQAAVRTWLTRHKSKLQWDRTEGVYRF